MPGKNILIPSVNVRATIRVVLIDDINKVESKKDIFILKDTSIEHEFGINWLATRSYGSNSNALVGEKITKLPWLLGVKEK